MKNYIAAVLGSSALMLAIVAYAYADAHDIGFSQTLIRIGSHIGGFQPQISVRIA